MKPARVDVGVLQAANLICGVCETDIYGEDGILVTSRVADCRVCKPLRDTLAGKGPCKSAVRISRVFTRCTLAKGHRGRHEHEGIAEWSRGR